MSESRRGRTTNEVVTIYWRDIPAQVNGQRGRERTQILLTERFQRAIDRAKRKAKITTAQADVAQWRRDTVRVDTDPFEAAATHAAQIEDDYTDAYLGKLGFFGGFAADITDEPVPDDPDLDDPDSDDSDPDDLTDHNLDERETP